MIFVLLALGVFYLIYITLRGLPILETEELEAPVNIPAPRPVYIKKRNHTHAMLHAHKRARRIEP